MAIIDAHVHITDSGEWPVAGHRASADVLLREMDAAGIEKAVLLPIVGLTSNETVARTVGAHPDRFIGFGCLSPAASAEDGVSKIINLGLRGLKFHPRIENRTLGDLERAGVLEATGGRLPIVVCGWLQSRAVPMAELTPFALDAIAKRHPRQTFILAHLGGHRFWDAAFCARSNPNVYLDCSYALDFFQGSSLEGDFVALIGRIDEKVIFGSDFPEIRIEQYLALVREMISRSLHPVDEDAVFGENLQRILRIHAL